MLDTNTASEDMVKLYDVLVSGDQDQMASIGKLNADRHFIKNLVFEYVKKVKTKMPKKLAFDLDDSEVLVWAEIENDDEQSEDFLLLLEAEINSKFHNYGYDVTSTIVEDRDNLPIPNHYAQIN